MIPDALTNAAKQFLATAETWRQDELDIKRRTLADFEKQLAEAQTKVRTLPVKIGEYRATIARLEAQTDADIARQALEPGQEKPKCPACGKQPDRATRPLSVGEHVTCQSCGLYLRVVDGAWQIVRPVENCGHVAADGTCGHPNALTPECHDGVVCPVKAEKQAELTLLDLTKLPPGTVCEAVGEILTYLGMRIKPGEVFRIVEPDDGMGDKHPTNIEIEFAGFSVPALVPARVVEEGESSE